MSVDKLDTGDLRWRKARASAGNGACVEVAPVNGHIAVRDSQNPGGSRLQYSRQSWQDFVQSIKHEIIFE